MNIVLFTAQTPTEDNFRGPSALMYHLLLHRCHGDKLRIYSTNANHVPLSMVEKSKVELNAEIVILNDDIYNFFHKRGKMAEFRIKAGMDRYFATGNYRINRSVLKGIADFNPDIIWVYGEIYTRVIKDLSCLYKVHVWGYDCFPLRHHRQLADRYVFSDHSDYQKILTEYKWAIFAEQQLKMVNCTYSVVGIEDRNMFEMITGRKDAKFYPHPHYSACNKAIDFGKDKLAILISGEFNQVTWTDAMGLTEELVQHKELTSQYKITILGKGWNDVYERLVAAGFEVAGKEWVDRYAEEVVKHDIQIIPISVGSGTKGKVLDALSMGLLCIGSEYAMENIYVKSGHSCFTYKNVAEVPVILRFIVHNKKLCEQIAENGRQQTLKWHNPKRIMKLIQNDLMGDKPYDGAKEYAAVLESLKPIIV